ncbi:hypothetical protein [Janibacter sp. Soil728]|uniref:hypothetical protein n=1 Tax=Janibacter sp. Soil728 TaxID=1736393 RepID=UPI000AEB3964|nr:hypothetical protein [Janibacter sp. Soil728]
MGQIVLPPNVIGYVFRTDCAAQGWSYIGQSTRLDQKHIGGYFGSSSAIKEAMAEHGLDGLTKRVLATAESALELHYLEMVSIAEARKNGVQLLNGDFGGPRPFPTMQRALWAALPAAMRVATDPKKFHKVITRNREMVEQAILDASSVSGDEYYIGLERDLLAVEDLSYDCPSCGSLAGTVCRTNSTVETKPHNPTSNHKARPRATS